MKYRIAGVDTDRIVHFSMGGSHRQYTKDTRALKSAGIPFEDTGAFSLGSKKRVLSVPVEYAEKVEKLGFSRSSKHKDFE